MTTNFIITERVVDTLRMDKEDSKIFSNNLPKNRIDKFRSVGIKLSYSRMPGCSLRLLCYNVGFLGSKLHVSITIPSADTCQGSKTDFGFESHC